MDILPDYLAGGFDGRGRRFGGWMMGRNVISHGCSVPEPQINGDCARSLGEGPRPKRTDRGNMLGA